MTILTKSSITITKTPLIDESNCDEFTADGFVAKNNIIDTEKCMRVGNCFNPQPFMSSNGRDADPLRENQKKKRVCVCACGCGFRIGARKVNRDKIIEMPVGPPGKPGRGVGALLCMITTMFLLVLMGVITAMQIYEQVTTDISQHNHYQGFCSIPLSRDLQMLESRKMPLRWKTTPNVGRAEPNIQVVSLMDEDPEHLFDLLREVLDIDIDESVEKISVFNNGHPVSFIHDFESNVTGIVDSDRCFTMDMDPSLVLQPELFLLGLQRGDEFDVTRVRSQLRALLPPLGAGAGVQAGAQAGAQVGAQVGAQAGAEAGAQFGAQTGAQTGARLGAALDKCADKPIYRLQKETGVVIRKRSADAPPHDFMQFAGKRVQEIEISNLAELLEFEQDNKQAQ